MSLHQSDPLSDTFFCNIVVNHEIIKRGCLSQQRALEEMLHRLISFFTITRGVILICIFSTFLGCVCSVPFSYGVCSGISIQSMCLMHHLLDTHLGFVGYRLQVLRPLLQSASGWALDQFVSGMYEAVSGFKVFPW